MTQSFGPPCRDLVASDWIKKTDLSIVNKRKEMIRKVYNSLLKHLIEWNFLNTFSLKEHTIFALVNI